jgi:hypothetical protein
MRRLVFPIVASALLCSACSDRTPTGAGDESASRPPAPFQTATALSSTASAFDCSQLEEVRVRFSDPGYLDHLRVGLYVQYVGVPPGPKKVRIWWDYQNAFGSFQDVRIDDADLERVEGRDVYGRVIEHEYEEVSAATPRQVRAELMIGGLSGGCARNRDIVVLPSGPVIEEDSSSSSPCGGGPCRVFVTSTRHEGNLGGIAGADAVCAARAGAAGLRGTFRAWLSDDTSSPATRFVHAPFAYVLLDGTELAASWSDLVGGGLSHHINVTELGTTADGLGTVWTRTLPNGDAASFPLGPDCRGWTEGSPNQFGTNGQHQGSLSLWSFLGASSCNARLRLYCFQQ